MNWIAAIPSKPEIPLEFKRRPGLAGLLMVEGVRPTRPWHSDCLFFVGTIHDESRGCPEVGSSSDSNHLNPLGIALVNRHHLHQGIFQASNSEIWRQLESPTNVPNHQVEVTIRAAVQLQQNLGHIFQYGLASLSDCRPLISGKRSTFLSAEPRKHHVCKHPRCPAKSIEKQ